MYQTTTIPIDHGNKNIKTSSVTYTSGLAESDNKPPLGNFLYYKNKYYTLTEQRIPYMRDKTIDERFFILTLFAIGMELELKTNILSKTIFEVELPIGLPPKHYGALYKKFECYFKRDKIINFIYHEKEYNIYMRKAIAFPQDYAAAMTIYQDISKYSKVMVINIGGFTLDYLLLKNGVADLSICDSLENGVIKLYHAISSKINSEYDILLEDFDIDCILKKQNTPFPSSVIESVLNITQSFTEDLLGILRERGIDLKSLYTVFVGGGALLLEPFISTSDKIGSHVFIRDIQANAKGYHILYNLQKKAGSRNGEKNKYVCTIGFNQNNPYHKKAAELLNQMPRGKADYIAQAILAYQEATESPFSTSMDYEKLKEYILQVIKEYECSKLTRLEKKKKYIFYP